jgi:hypothetical protein
MLDIRLLYPPVSQVPYEAINLRKLNSDFINLVIRNLLRLDVLWIPNCPGL